MDSAASIFSTAVYQGEEAYANANGDTDVENSDGVKNAWGYATEAAPDGITAGLPQFTDPPGTRPSRAARSPPWPARPG